MEDCLDGEGWETVKFTFKLRQNDCLTEQRRSRKSEKFEEGMKVIRTHNEAKDAREVTLRYTEQQSESTSTDI